MVDWELNLGLGIGTELQENAWKGGNILFPINKRGFFFYNDQSTGIYKNMSDLNLRSIPLKKKN